MTVFKMFKIFLMILLFSFPAWAHTHDDPNLHEDDHHLHEADFEMELDDCNAVHISPRVLGSELDALFFFWTDEPGFDSHAGTFPIGSFIGFNILDALKKWNGSGFDALDPNTEETLTVNFLFGTTLATCCTGIGFVPGFEIPVASDGSWHKHLGYTLNGVGHNDPNNGIYLLELELYNTSSDPNIANSEPFWIVFNLGMPEQEHHNTIHWIDENLAQLPDLEQDGCIDFKDFSILASQWLNTNCDCWNNWCDGADITENGGVDLFDLAKIASNWLKSLDGGEEKNSSN